MCSGAASGSASVNQSVSAGPCRPEVAGHEAKRARSRTRSTRATRPTACDFRTTRPAATIGFSDVEPEAAPETTRVSDSSLQSVGSQYLPLSSPLLGSITPEPVGRRRGACTTMSQSAALLSIRSPPPERSRHARSRWRCGPARGSPRRTKPAPRRTLKFNSANVGRGLGVDGRSR